MFKIFVMSWLRTHDRTVSGKTLYHKVAELFNFILAHKLFSLCPHWLTDFTFFDRPFLLNADKECCTVSTFRVESVTCPHSEHTG